MLERVSRRQTLGRVGDRDAVSGMEAQSRPWVPAHKRNRDLWLTVPLWSRCPRRARGRGQPLPRKVLRDAWAGVASMGCAASAAVVAWRLLPRSCSKGRLKGPDCCRYAGVALRDAIVASSGSSWPRGSCSLGCGTTALSRPSLDRRRTFRASGARPLGAGTPRRITRGLGARLQRTAPLDP